MSKRFIDTDIFKDEWFMDLSVPGKLLWIYIITNCDHAGIVKFNQKLIQFQTGIKELPRVTKELSKRLVTVSEDLYFIPKFLDFQYPGFPNSKAPQQNGAVKILERYGLFKNGSLTVSNSSVTVSDSLRELPNSIGDVKGEEDGNEIFPEEIEKVFKKFLEMRLKLKKPATDYAVKLLRNKLRKLSNSKQSEAIKILNQSITNSWKDLYEIKEQSLNNNNHAATDRISKQIDTTNNFIAKFTGEVPVDPGTIQS
jgi:hypothetical protein